MQDHRFSLVAPSRDLDQLVEKTKAYIRGANDLLLNARGMPPVG